MCIQLFHLCLTSSDPSDSLLVLYSAVYPPFLCPGHPWCLAWTLRDLDTYSQGIFL